MNMFNTQHPEDAVYYSWINNAQHLKLSEHFTLSEFVCKSDRSGTLVHPAVILAAEAIRRHFGAPVRVNSAYRTEEHNKAIGGAKQSKHLLGMAMDITVDGVHPDRVADYADRIGLGGVGRYETFTHIDVYGIGRRWSG